MARNNDREARAGRGVAVFETREAPWLEDLETATLLKFLRDFDRYHRDLMVQVPGGGEQAVPVSNGRLRGLGPSGHHLSVWFSGSIGLC